MESETTTSPTNAPTPVPPTETGTPLTAHSSSVGPVVGSIVIVAVLALGAMYFWYDSQNTTSSVATEQPVTRVATTPAVDTTSDPVLNSLMTTSSADTASSIEADLNSTDTGNAASDLQVQ